MQTITLVQFLSVVTSAVDTWLYPLVTHKQSYSAIIIILFSILESKNIYDDVLKTAEYIKGQICLLSFSLGLKIAAKIQLAKEGKSWEYKRRGNVEKREKNREKLTEKRYL